MATVYFVKEGLDRTDSYRAFASMPISDLESKFKEKKIVYLGTIRPALNIEPSMYEERVVVEVGASKNRRFPPPRKSDSRFSCSERGRLAWDSLASSI